MARRLVGGILLAVGCLLTLNAGALGSSVDYPNQTLAGGYAAGHFGDVWDLTKADLVILVKVDMTGMIDELGSGAHAWSEIGVHDLTGGDFNPNGKGVWLATDYNYAVNGLVPNPGSADLDDKFILQKTSGHGEGDYSLPSTPPAPGNNYGVWFDRDGVDPWQAGYWGAGNGTTYNTNGLYQMVIRLHAETATSGTAYLTVNGVNQGFYTAGWKNAQPEIYPAGMRFTGDLAHLQVFYGLYGYGATHTVQFGNTAVVFKDVVWVDKDWVGTPAGTKVDGHYYQYDAFSAIQDGATSVGASGTVNVADGTYVEQVEVTKDLTLQGSGSATVVQAPNTLTKYFSTPGNKNYPIIYIHDANDVTLRGLVVDGGGKGNVNYRFIGIAFSNAGGTVDQVEVKGIENTPFSGSQHGVGIYAYNADGTPRSLVISNSYIHEFQKNGIALSGNGLTVDVKGNTVTGAGKTGSIAQNGIQVASGAGGAVEGNSVSGVWYTGAYWGSTGILIIGAAPGIQVLGNNVVESQMGINSDTDSTVIERNTIRDSDWSIVLLGANGEVHYNSIAGSASGFWTDYAADATLNWWGSPSGPWADTNADGVAEYAGGGDAVYGPAAFSPWLGSDPDGNPAAPGVQITSPLLIVVAPVGPVPTGGYLNAAIGGANSIPGVDAIQVQPGSYAATSAITDGARITSSGGACSTTLTGNIALNVANILLGRFAEGFTIAGDITVGIGVDASTSHINWNNLQGTVTNNGLGTLDATYNYWGVLNPGTKTVGLVLWVPFLPVDVCTVIGYMSEYHLDPDAAIAFATFLLNQRGMGDPALALAVANQYGISLEEAATLIREYGSFRVFWAMQLSPDYEGFTRQLLGYAMNGGGAGGGILDQGIAGGGGSINGVALEASYTVGEPIHIAFTLTDPITGGIVSNAIATLSVVRVNTGDVTEFISWEMIPYDAASGQYALTYATAALVPGTYDLFIGTNDGQQKQIRIQVTAP